MTSCLGSYQRCGAQVRRTIKGKLLDKSYSPVSGPDVQGYVDLLVKGYCRRVANYG